MNSFRLLIMLCCWLFSQVLASESVSQVNFTPEEQAWIKQNPTVRIGVFDLAPYQIIKEGRISGYQVEMMQAIVKSAGLQSELITHPSLQDKMEGARSGVIDIVLDIIPTPEKAQYIAFSNKSIEINMAIFAQDGRDDIFDSESLRGKIVASYPGYSFEKILQKVLPESTIVHAQSAEDMLRLVSTGKADACVQELHSGAYMLTNAFINNVQPKGYFQLKNKSTLKAHEWGVRRDLPILKSILDKADESLSAASRQRIWNRWFSDDIRFRPVQASSTGLTDAEKVWLREHPIIRLASHRSLLPVMGVNAQGNYEGIAADYLHLIEERLGVQFQKSPEKPWVELLEMMKNRELDLLSAGVETEQRKDYITFTQPYISNPLVIVTTDEIDYVNGLKGLNGKKVALIKGYASTEILSRKHPYLDRELFEDIPSALLAVSEKKVFAFVSNIAIVSHVIRKEGFSNLKVSGDLPFRSEIGFGVRKDWPELAEILQKTMNSISEEEHRAIQNRWISVRYEQGFDYELLWKIALGFALLVMALVWWNRMLSKKVAEGIEKYKHQEIQLIQQSKMAEMGEMMGAIIHQWKQPLNVISLQAQFVGIMNEESEQPDSQCDDAMKQIEQQVEFMSQTMNDFKNFFSPESQPVLFMPCKMLAKIKNMFTGVFEKNSIHIRISDQEGFNAMGNPGEFMQVGLNIFNNAKDAMEMAGRKQGEITCLIETNKDVGIIRIRDDAGGIPEALLPDKLFQSHVSTKGQKGTGIGLQISKNIIEHKMGGRLYAQNWEKGAEFVIELPLAKL